MKLRAGLKLQSAVCDAQVVVVKAPDADVEVACGGAPMVADGETPEPGATLDASVGDAVLLGKRYADDDLGIELLCTKAGEGALAVDGTALPLKGAKPLPSSD